LPTFDIEILETVVHRCRYSIEAADLAQAKQKALEGDTVAETTLAVEEVTNRELLSKEVI